MGRLINSAREATLFLFFLPRFPSSHTPPLLPPFTLQAITEWCVYVGAPTKTRGMLIKKAKNNGDRLGFLV